jgi:feruloyl esterase
LSPEQVAAVRTAYQGVKISNGTYAAYPLTRGGELGWQRFIADPERIPGAMPVPADGGLSGLRAAMFGDAAYDLSRFDAERDLMKLRASRFADMFEADDPDVTSFVTRGGKLLIWHGMDDPGPSAAATVDYFNELERVMTSRANAVRSSVRLFLAPGVYHCRGGPGPDRLDALDSLDRWVETGAAPERLLARKLDSPLVRPLCPYPALGRYKGKGDPNDPMSFECR